MGLLEELEAAAANENAADAQRLLAEIGEAANTRELARAAGIAACEQDAPR